MGAKISSQDFRLCVRKGGSVLGMCADGWRLLLFCSFAVLLLVYAAYPILSYPIRNTTVPFSEPRAIDPWHLAHSLINYPAIARVKPLIEVKLETIFVSS